MADKNYIEQFKLASPATTLKYMISNNDPMYSSTDGDHYA